MFEPPPPLETDETLEFQELVEEICHNLNPMERRTWLRLLDGLSIFELAKEESVSRAAIHDRLRRMTKKNDYVAIWWRLKNKVNQYGNTVSYSSV